MNANEYRASYQKVLDLLNPAQKKAVETIEGPVLVVAGPGTGKTQILAARIGKILLETDASPYNILCLTYTDAGAIAMRNRLVDFIGPDAYNVNIYTFHGFCNMVIQENLDYFGVRGLQAVSDLELVDLFIELIDAFDANHPLKRFTGDVYYESGRLKSLFHIMKAENWSADYIQTQVKEYLSSLEDREEYRYKRGNSKKGIKAGDLKVDAIRKEEDKMKLLTAAAHEFDTFQTKLLTNRRYDFDDMILMVLKAFQNEEDLLLKYQERYLYFLVDEFQDTNGTQNQILQALTDYWDVPNVFAVGDDDQAIYRFQGANLKNIFDFYTSYQHDISVVILEDNYRSQQTVLDASKVLIDHNEDRLTNVIQGLSKTLKSHTTYQSPEDVAIHEYQSIFQEEMGVLDIIKKKHQEGVSYGDMAIIYHNHSQVENLQKLLQLEEVPLNIKRRQNILEQPIIKQLVAIFEYLTEESKRVDSAEYLLFEMMHYPYFGINTKDAALISRQASYQHDQPKKAWRTVMGDAKQLKEIGVQDVDAVLKLFHLLGFWMEDQFNHTIQVLLEKILTKGGVIEYCMNHPERNWLLKLITSFFDFIKEESTKDHKLNVKKLLDIIKKMEKHQIPLMVNQWSQSEEGLNLVTAHSAKGLEYEHVFIIGATSDKWEKKKNRSSTYSFPDNLVSSNPVNKEEEERRLFYVAMTRAKKSLFISYAKANNDGKALEPSKFIMEIKASDVLHTQGQVAEDQLSKYSSQLLLHKALGQVPWLDHNLVDNALKGFRMSVTSLNKYLRCPTSFYFENIVRVPSARNVSMGFGSSVHYALETFFRDMLADEKKAFPYKEQLLLRFEEGMQIYRSHFTDKDYANRMEYAHKILPAYYEQYIEGWNKVVVLEYDIKHAVYEHVPLSGKLDKLEFDGNAVNVVDYKTGKPENGLKKMKAPSDKDIVGGDYWRQIVFYKILMDADKRKTWEMISGEMDFLEQNTKRAYTKQKLVVSLDDLELVKKQLITSYDAIIKHEFENGCGKDDCMWCNFVKDNFSAEHLNLEKIGQEEM